jgi:hypothetical protein
LLFVTAPNASRAASNIGQKKKTIFRWRSQHGGSKVDLAVAWQIAKLDARACEIALERDNSTAVILRVYRNQLQWLSFWASRHPNDKWRTIFERQLEDRKAGLKALKDKATLMLNLPILEELQQVFSWRS